MNTVIKLSPSDIYFATDAGIARHKINLDAGKDSVIIPDMNTLETDIQGACAELAVSKYFNIAWTGRLLTLDEWKTWKSSGGHDVGPLEVRSTRYLRGHLPLFKHDLECSPYILVIVRSKSEYELVGWIWGYEGMQREFWADPGKHNQPYFAVPRTELRGIPELSGLLQREKVN